MAAKKHAPEPWRIEHEERNETGDPVTAIFAADGRRIADDQTYYPFFDPDQAERIVACVNFCTGIPTKALTPKLMVEIRRLLELGQLYLPNERANCAAVLKNLRGEVRA